MVETTSNGRRGIEGMVLALSSLSHASVLRFYGMVSLHLSMACSGLFHVKQMMIVFPERQSNKDYSWLYLIVDICLRIRKRTIIMVDLLIITSLFRVFTSTTTTSYHDKNALNFHKVVLRSRRNTAIPILINSTTIQSENWRDWDGTMMLHVIINSHTSKLVRRVETYTVGLLTKFGNRNYRNKRMNIPLQEKFLAVVVPL